MKKLRFMLFNEIVCGFDELECFTEEVGTWIDEHEVLSVEHSVLHDSSGILISYVIKYEEEKF